jgi:rubrerythrin
MAIESNLTAIEIVGVATRAEIDAHQFYTEMAKRIRNQVVKERILNLAAEERRHERILKNLLKKWTGEEDPQIPKNSLFPITELINDDMSHEQVLEKAIELEQAAAKRYIEASRVAQEDSGRRQLEYLAEFERTHERILASELDALKKDKEWFDEDTLPGTDKPIHLGP